VGFRGRHHTPETRAKLSAANKLRAPASIETREKIRASKLGKKRSPEFCAKMSIIATSRTDRHHSKETKAKISASNKGKHQDRLGVKSSAETRNKISKANKGRKLTDEHRANISASRKANFANKSKNPIN